MKTLYKCEKCKFISEHPMITEEHEKKCYKPGEECCYNCMNSRTFKGITKCYLEIGEGDPVIVDAKSKCNDWE